MLELAKDLLTRPSRALGRLIRDDRALSHSAVLYALYLAAAVLFYAWKPVDFPPPPDPAQSLPGGGVVFWAKIHAWEPVFTLIWIGFAGWFSRFLAAGRLPTRLFGSGVMVLVPILLIFSADLGIPRGISHTLWIVFLGALVPGLRKVDCPVWRALASLIMSVYVVEVALMPLSVAAVLMDQAVFYAIVELATLLWTLGLTTYGVSRITRLSAARAFCVTIFSLCCQMLVIVFLRNIGALPAYVFKAMMAL